MDCDRQQNPDGPNRKDHLDAMPLQRPLNICGNAPLVGKVFRAPFVFGWVGCHGVILVKSYPSPPLSV